MKSVLVFALLLLISLPTNASSINIALISPTTESDAFWSQVTKIAQASAQDLGIKLTVYNNASNRILLNEQLYSITQSENKPDYIIFLPFNGSIEHSFQLLEQAKIPFVTLERTYEQDLLFSKIGKPKDKFNYWLGEVFFDNTKAGALLTETLLSYAKNNQILTNKQATAFGLSGDFHYGTTERNLGFLNVTNQHDIEVKQLVYTNWIQDIAKAKFLKLVQRYAAPDIVWCASDIIAIGVLDAANQLGLKENKDFVIGGFDWTPEAIQLIQKKQMTASVGGHIFQGARALLKIFDYHHGLDTFNRTSQHQGYLLEIIHPNNVNDFLLLSENNDWNKVNFSQFSSVKNEKPTEFSAINILKSLAKNNAD